jgi:hypothetical protein
MRNEQREKSNEQRENGKEKVAATIFTVNRLA